MVYGSTDRYADGRALLDHGFADYTWLRADKMVPITEQATVHGASDVQLPAWEASQAVTFLDADQRMELVAVMGQTVLSSPLDLPA